MKILHTADLHLREHGDERWQAMQGLLQLGLKEQVDLLAVSGDLFDQSAGLLKMQEPLRALFSNLPFTVLILPGNHDYVAFREGIYLGNSVKIMDDWKLPHLFGGVAVWGLPFEPLKGVEILTRLREMASLMTSDKTNILLFHGELQDAYFSPGEMGEEGVERYMPVRLSFFQDIPFDYILAGHFHARFRAWTLPRQNGNGRDRYFIYPGSPVSVTRRETGQRKASLVETGRPPGEYYLDTYHYDERVIRLDPFSGKSALDQLSEALSGLHPAAELLLSVTGFVDGSAGMDETSLVEEVRRITAGKCAGEPRYAFQDIRSVLQDDLFKTFLEKLQRGEEDPVRREKRREMAVKAMVEAKLC